MNIIAYKAMAWVSDDIGEQDLSHIDHHPLKRGLWTAGDQGN